ncbi:MAG: LysE family translocator [Nocardioidaceae bacterium]|nr:LysE family translocator [Nocardioidaceae bacterium]
MDLVRMMPAFVIAVLLISASPGPAMALIFRRAALHGMRTAAPLIAGLEVGLYLWALAAAAGFAALVAASAAAYWTLKVVGAVVLIWLGVRAWRHAWSLRGEVGDEVTPSVAPLGDDRTWWRAFRDGLVVQLANPKAAVFMIAFYPQFVPADRPLLATTAALALVQVLLESAFYLTLAALVTRAGAVFRRITIRRRLEAASGAVLIGLGARVLASSR